MQAINKFCGFHKFANPPHVNQVFCMQNIDLASNTSRLIHDGVLLWKTARGKLNGM